jgi:hypothetical protein
MNEHPSNNGARHATPINEEKIYRPLPDLPMSKGEQLIASGLLANGKYLENATASPAQAN